MRYFKPGQRYKYIGPAAEYWTFGNIYTVFSHKQINDPDSEAWMWIEVNAHAYSIHQVNGITVGGFGVGYDIKGVSLLNSFIKISGFKNHLPEWL